MAQAGDLDVKDVNLRSKVWGNVLYSYCERSFERGLFSLRSKNVGFFGVKINYFGAFLHYIE